MIYKFTRQHEGTLKKVLNEIKVNNPARIDIAELDWEEAMIIAQVTVELKTYFEYPQRDFEIASLNKILSGDSDEFLNRFSYNSPDFWDMMESVEDKDLLDLKLILYLANREEKIIDLRKTKVIYGNPKQF